MEEKTLQTVEQQEQDPADRHEMCAGARKALLLARDGGCPHRLALPSSGASVQPASSERSRDQQWT